jgi:UDP-3-O-[3-hydroxymyristoyl] glucosamine N-acyltransferase
MEFTAEQIAGLLEGQIEGNPNVRVSRLAKIEEGEPGSLTFLANPKYESFIYSTGASLAIVSNSFQASSAIPNTLTLIRVEDPYASFARLLEFYNARKKDRKGISPSASIDSGVTLGEDLYIGSGVVIGEGSSVGSGVKLFPGVTIGENVSIGEGTTLYYGVRVYEDTIIGRNCVIHAGVVIGSDGFGFAAPSADGFSKVAQIGNVIIGNDVEIGANSTIDRATMGSTRIGNGVKLDNLIQIAHNVEIGDNTAIAAQTGVAGSTKIGRNCLIGGQVGIVGHIQIADGVKIAAQSGIGSSILQEGAVVQGSPAFDIGEYKRAYVGFRKLPEILQRLNKLETTIKSGESH